MNQHKPFTCVQCGNQVTGGMLCETCIASNSHNLEVEAVKPKREAAKVILSILLLTIVGAMVAFGAMTYKQDLAASHQKFNQLQRKLELNRAVRKAQARSDTPVATQSQQAPSAPASTYVPPVSYETTYTPPPPTYEPQSTYTPPPVQQVTCYACKGLGSVDEDCDKCYGLGDLECEHCAAYNARLNRGSDPYCPECGGMSHQKSARGSRAFGVAFVYSCSKCRGKGSIHSTCHTCHGLGHL